MGTPKCPVAGGTFSELNAVAVYLASQDKLGEAEACLTDAILTTMGAFRMLSDIATVNGQFGRAAGIAELMDTLANTGDAKLFHAKKLLRINQNEKAKEKLDLLIEHNAENAEINHLMGVTQFRLQKNTEALASLEKARALDPNNDVYSTELDTLKKVISGELPNPAEEAAAASANG